MNFLELAAARYSLRKFSDVPVEAEKLNAILEAGRLAPTAHNLQPQRIFVMQTPESVEKADACLNVHYKCPVLIVIGYDPKESWKRETDGKDHGEIDATIVTTQMMLEAAELGLGTTFIGMFEPEKFHAAFPEMDGLNISAVLTLGYPAETAHPAKLHLSRKAMEETVRYL